MTLLEYLQEPPAKFSPSTIERQSGKVTELRDLGVDTYKVDIAPVLLQTPNGAHGVPPRTFIRSGATASDTISRSPSRSDSRALPSRARCQCSLPAFR
jgi:hypothetical protein